VDVFETKHNPVSPDEYEKQCLPGIGKELGEMMLYIDEYAYVGDGNGYTDWKDVSCFNLPSLSLEGNLIDLKLNGNLEMTRWKTG
jgi:hypothetical protein